MADLSDPVPVHSGQVRNTGPCSAVSYMSSCRNMSDCRSGGREFDPAWSHAFMEIDHEIISMVILPPSTVTSESMCTKYWLTA